MANLSGNIFCQSEAGNAVERGIVICDCEKWYSAWHGCIHCFIHSSTQRVGTETSSGPRLWADWDGWADVISVLMWDVPLRGNNLQITQVTYNLLKKKKKDQETKGGGLSGKVYCQLGNLTAWNLGCEA